MPLPKTQQTQAPQQQHGKAKFPPLLPESAAPQGMRERAQTPLRSWDTPGQEVTAYYLGMRPSTKYKGRSLVDLVDDDAVVETWPCPVILEQLLRGLPLRTVVTIRYRGEEESAQGSTKHFQVFVGDMAQ